MAGFSVGMLVLMGEIEFCFSVKYPELHGRDAEEPWSMRQLLVYQRRDIQPERSTWITLQCPLRLQDILKDAASAVSRSEGRSSLTLQMMILNYTLKNWRGYINHLETVIEDLVGYTYKETPSQPLRPAHHLLTHSNRTKRPVSHALAIPTNSTTLRPSATPSSFNSTTV